MKRPAETLVEFLALTATTAYVFWRWVDHASYGGPIAFYLVFHLVIVAVPLMVGAFFVWRAAPTSPLLAIATLMTLAVCVGYMASLGVDLANFQAIGGPGSKEMRELLRHQHIIDAEAAHVFLEAAALRIQREFWYTGLIVLLVFAYLSRLFRTARTNSPE